MIDSDKIKGSLLGLIVGDALGLPVEFIKIDKLIANPVDQMRGYGSHNQPPGTWSDDSSMTLCLLEVLVQGYDLKKVADNFVAWADEAKWTPHGKLFGMGSTTRAAIDNIRKGVSIDTVGMTDESSNGNGSLMRILPLLWYCVDKDIDARYQIIKEVSALTHAHIRSVLACFQYLEFARYLLIGLPVAEALKEANSNFLNKFVNEGISTMELKPFFRLIQDGFDKTPREEISSGGYVMHTLEASIWCILTTSSYKDAVIKAVNLGGDADSTAAVTGGLAGIIYGLAGIPEDWLKQIARLGDIELLIDDFCKKYSNKEIDDRLVRYES